MTENTRPTIAVIGGTGALGSGLAGRWARAGYPVVVGSRSPEKAQATATGFGGKGTSQAEAAAMADIVVLTVPYATHTAVIDEIRSHCAGKTVIDATVPLVPPKVGTVQLPAEGCAAVQAQRAFGEGVTVVSAFHNVSAHKLQGSAPIECDVLVFGDDKEARESVLRLVEAAGLRGIHGGPLANSAAAEALTSVLITINRLYRVDGAGIRIVGKTADGSVL
ncbi:MAG TPA: NADPH-dependent F420 reductase [Azospirillum sp.]|nr:NADPH-dependent F420 reductase [Azospirillum sp.]